MTTKNNSSFLKGILYHFGFTRHLDLNRMSKYSNEFVQMLLPMLTFGRQTKLQTTQNHLLSSCKKWELR